MTADSPGELLRAYSTTAKKRFGQHFITDPVILENIVDAAGVEPGDHVLEIGPGCGTLTWALRQRGAQVTAIEIDRDAVAFLREQFAVDARLRLIEADATSFDFSELDELDDPPRLVVANLPYNVAVTILFQLLDAPVRFERLALMFQREVAERITATPGSKTYGSLTLEIQLRARARRVMRLKGGAFTPPPNVESAVVLFEPHEDPRIADPKTRERFSEVVTAGFAMRRKTLRNALKAKWPVEEVESALGEAGIDRRTRAEEVGFEGFLRIATSLMPMNPEDRE